MGWPFQWVLQGFVLLQAGYTLGLGQKRALLAVGCLLLGQWTFGALPLHPFNCPPHSTSGSSLSMGKQQHQ